MNKQEALDKVLRAFQSVMTEPVTTLEVNKLVFVYTEDDLIGVVVQNPTNHHCWEAFANLAEVEGL